MSRRRRVKPKTVRRLLLAGVTLALVIAVAVSVIWVRRWQNERQMQRWRAQGLEEFHAGKYFEALDSLSKPLKRRREDPEALAAWAESRENLPEADGHHLRDAMQTFKEAWALDPSKHDVGVHLLRLYLDLEQFVEARDLAPQLRPPLESTTEADIEVLTLEAQALSRRGDREAFAATLDRLLTLKSLPVDVLVRRVAEDARAGRTAEVNGLIARVKAAFPGDPRTRLLELVGIGSGGTRDEAVFSGLCDLFRLDERTARALEPAPLPDAMTALMATGLFDMLSRPQHAYSMIRQGADAFPENETLAGLAARRGWQRGEFEDVIARADAAPIPPKARADVLAFKALSLLDTGHPEQVKQIAAQLAEYKGDFAARAWSKALTALANDDGTSPRRTFESLVAALDAHPYEPVLSFLVGESLARLQRFDEARAKWKDAIRSPLSAGWVAPALRAAETLRLEARDAESIDAALAATIATSAGPQAIMAWVEAETAALQQDMRTRDQAREFLRRIDALLAARTPEMGEGDRRAFDRLELSRIVALSRVGRRDEAISAARGLMQRQPPVDQGNLERLAILSQQESLGLGAEMLERAGAGATPAIVLSAALERAGRGDATAGAELLAAAGASAQPPARRAWDQARAQYAELTGSDDALTRWRALVEAYPKEPDVLRTALTAPSLSRDPALIEQIVVKFNALTGATENNEPAFVQLARARALLSGSVDRREHQQAVTMLYKLVAAAPRLITARELLIQGLCMSDPAAGITPDITAAMSQIESAASFAARPSVFLLSGAQMMQSARNFQNAGRLLRRVAEDASAPAEARLQASSMLVAQGDYESAARPLEELVASAGDAPDPRALGQLARVYQAQRRDADALGIYRRLADAPISDPDTVVQVAAALASRGDEALARRLMERLGSMDLPAARLSVARGRYAELSGDPETAGRLYEEAVAADPTDSGAWQFLVSLSLSNGDRDAAARALQRARSALPDDPQLQILEQRLALTGAGGDDVDLEKLREVLARDPARARAAAAVAALDQARKNGTLDDPAAMKALAESFRDVLAMQGYVARRLASLPGADPETAARIAERAMAAFPTEPEAARVAVEVAATQERWADMLRAAEAWRERDRGRSPEVDLAVADARSRLGQSAAAATILEPHVQPALAEPAERVNRLILQTYAAALLAQKKTTQAHDTLRPLLQSPAVRDEVWVPLAALAVADAGSAEQWLSEAAATLEPSDSAGRIAIARGYATLAERFPQRGPAQLDAAEKLLSDDASGGSAAALELRGLIQRQNGRAAEAMKSLQAAVDAEPARVTAVGPLCALLAESGRPAEALPIAQRAYDLGDKGVDATLVLARAMAAAAAPGALDMFKRASELAPARFDVALAGAAAAETARDPRSALRFYERALASPALPGEIAAGVRNNAAYAIYSAQPSRDELERARTLARQAVQDSPVAAHYDTLAHVEAALGSRQAAIDAYRKALELDRSSVSSRLGLAAELLQEGGDGRSEATAIVGEISEAGLDEGQRSELARLREQLQK